MLVSHIPTCYNPVKFTSPAPPLHLPPTPPKKRNLHNIVQSVYTWRHGGHVGVPNQSSGSWTLSFVLIILDWYWPCERKGFIIDHSRPKRNWRQCLCCMMGNVKMVNYLHSLFDFAYPLIIWSVWFNSCYKSPFRPHFEVKRPDMYKPCNYSATTVTGAT